MIKIITHPGIFHADECVAIAAALILNEYNDTRFWNVSMVCERIERRNPTVEELENPEIWVFDVGKVLQPEFNNFDHHQDKSLPASNLLVLQEIFARGFISAEEASLLKEMLFDHVSLVDTQGEKVDNMGVPTLSRIIRGLNGLENGFEMAMQIAFASVLSAFNAAKAKIAAQRLWDEVEKFGHYAVNDSSSFISGWQELAKNEGINYLITPNREPGKYQILSRDSEEFSVPVYPTQTHNGGWMAVYPSKEEAIAHVAMLNPIWKEGFKPSRNSWAW